MNEPVQRRAGDGSPAPAADDLRWWSAERIRDAIARKDVTAVEVTQYFLERADKLDPELHVYSELDREGALAAAHAADASLARGELPGPLHGVPTAIKDHVPVAGLRGHQLGDTPAAVAKCDHFGVERIRKAGAIIFGTNSMLGAGGGGTLAGEGLFTPFNWDAEARNPWDTRHVPGWSSSGGAAAVAAGMLPFAIGSDGGGLTRLPAAYSGIVGFHPTAGLIPELDYERPRPPAGITVGPLTRDVRDAAHITQVMAGPDGRDPFSLQTQPDNFLAHIEHGVAGLRCAWTDDFGFTDRYAAPESPRVIVLVRAEAQKFEGLGATVEETREFWDDIMPGRMAQWLAFYPTAGLPAPSAETLQAGFEARGRNWDRFHKLFRTHDVILSATSQRITRPIDEWEAAWTTAGPSYPGGSFMGSYCSHTDMFNWLKFPAISIPCGFIEGFPVGLQVAGPPGSEATIFRVANAYQRAFPRLERPPVS
ncbi:aspartyl-tRNA(Asn)/glutamyl-tRNA(Gln) amidotransferase subunit A [Sphingomonas laterariae]|uniref:Aspartyl-tRNA(Asn)/glutamyl-tRNA(Gln) amidotransferase subunit A n=1 Tax=Edaphosphingomonas laterariae TaxID=861865 RepID=A0A239J7P8_9SPHN|nr:amidase [Sphingomonas laterariae]SNT01860.1 aspartyl-tRNA(Asn)/glutamyl-tRNA(Gln) amidotransferase subunit A [Sphingomonas laterariae]